MRLKSLLFMLLAVLFVACDDNEPEQGLVPGGVDLFTASGSKVFANGQTITMPAADTELIITLGSRGITPQGLSVLNPDPTMTVELLDPYAPDKLEVYDRIKCQDDDKVWYDNLYKQRIRVTASHLTGDPEKYTDRSIQIKVIPVGGYNVYSVFTVFHPKP